MAGLSKVRQSENPASSNVHNSHIAARSSASEQTATVVMASRGRQQETCLTVNTTSYAMQRWLSEHPKEGPWNDLAANR